MLQKACNSPLAPVFWMLNWTVASCYPLTSHFPLCPSMSACYSISIDYLHILFALPRTMCPSSYFDLVLNSVMRAPIDNGIVLLGNTSSYG